MRIRIDDCEVTGTPGEIVAAMRERAWEEGKTLEGYMGWVAKNLWRFAGKSLALKGETEEEQCRDFLKQLSVLGIFQVEEAT